MDARFEESYAESLPGSTSKYSKTFDKIKRKIMEGGEKQITKSIDKSRADDDKHYTFLLLGIYGDGSSIKSYASILQKVKAEGSFELLKKKKSQNVEDVRKNPADLLD